MHVIPVEKAIEMENESVDLEHISYWLSKYEGKYAASPCSCRRSRLTHDEGCADDPEAGALQLEIWQTMLWRHRKTDDIFQKKKLWRFSDRQKKMVLYIRLQTSTEKIKFLLSVTVM